MTVKHQSYKLSVALIRIVRKEYFLTGFGIKNCGDPQADGDLYDIYLRKQLYKQGIDCDVDLKTINKL